MQYAIPKGVFDILPLDPDEENRWRNSDRWQYVESVIRQTCDDYGFKEIRTPLFERTELFIRGVGEGSDIVTKEMYTFEDKGGRLMTLRPEGTASVMRAFVEKKLYTQPTLHKYFYLAPMFRYERPQAGRYRQHHQFGAEAIGIGKPEQDVEMIDLLCEVYRRLGLKNLNVMINTVGDELSRTSYSEALRTFLKPHFEKLSEDSKVRFTKNVLRILDSKDPQDHEVLKGAPQLIDYLNEECREHFAHVCKLLEELKISYEISAKLVRGLDYYNKTVFEITSGDLGAQNSIGGGGRYDGLIETIGGPALPSVGFGTGIERILQTMMKQNAHFPSPAHPKVILIPLGDKAKDYCFSLICRLRHEKISCDIDLSGKKVQHGLQLANHLQADYCLIIGDQEIQSQEAQLKNMNTRESTTIKLSHIVDHLKEIRK